MTVEGAEGELAVCIATEGNGAFSTRSRKSLSKVFISTIRQRLAKGLAKADLRQELRQSHEIVGRGRRR
jgi:hypothetical protein